MTRIAWGKMLQLSCGLRSGGGEKQLNTGYIFRQVVLIDSNEV